MTFEHSDNLKIWQQFNELAALSETEREKKFSAGGTLFISSLVRLFMTNSAIPEIDDATDFSDFIVESRENYRLWNQRLMSLMISFKADTQRCTKSLQDFSATCPWRELVESADDFVDSSS